MIQAYQRTIIENVLFYVILFYLSFFSFIVTSDLWIFSTVLRDDTVVDDM